MVFAAAAQQTSMALLRVRRQSIARHFAAGLRLIGVLRHDHLVQKSVEVARNSPLRVIFLEFSQIRNVADVVAFARFLDVTPVQLAPREIFDTANGFQHRDAVAAPAA